MFSLRNTCIVIFFSFCAGHPAGAVEDESTPSSVGFIDAGRVFAADDVATHQFNTGRDLLTYYLIKLWSCSTAETELRKNGVARFQFGQFTGGHAPLRWRIAHKAIWAQNETSKDDPKPLWRIDVADLDCFDILTESGREKYGKKYKRDTKWYCRPIEKIADFDKGARAYFDFLPTSSTAGMLFVVSEGQLRVWHATAKPNPGTFQEGFYQYWDVEWVNMKDETCPAELKENYQVFGDSSNWYFYTLSGKIYLCGKPPEGQKRKLELLYADADSPIKSLITDTATNKTFAFTAPDEPKNAKGKRVYFELAPKLDPKPYEVKPLTGVKMDLRIKTIWELAQVLVADGKVKAP